jgi:hypothetical protein
MKLNPEKTPLAIVLRIQKDGTYGHIVGHIETPSTNEERRTTHLPFNHPLGSLVLHSQASEGNDKIYGYEVCCVDGHRLTQYDLERKLSIVRPVNASLERQRRELGSALSYGQWISRVAAAIGAKSIVMAQIEPTANNSHWISGRPGEMVYQIDDTARRLVAWCNRNVKAAA